MTAENRLFEMLISTEVKGDLLVLFHKNPGLIDTYDGVARRIGRIAKSIEADVRDLVTLGILKVRQIGSREVLLFDRSKDRETQETIVNQLKTLKTGREA
ncbi:MAG TPA: hypothetical protein VGA05_03055 [Candidatus Bathyarchaeia archaeon]